MRDLDISFQFQLLTMALVQESSVLTFCVLQYNAVSLNDDMAQQNRHGAGMSNLVTNSGLLYILTFTIIIMMFSILHWD